MHNVTINIIKFHVTPKALLLELKIMGFVVTFAHFLFECVDFSCLDEIDLLCLFYQYFSRKEDLSLK